MTISRNFILIYVSILVISSCVVVCQKSFSSRSILGHGYLVPFPVATSKIETQPIFKHQISHSESPIVSYNYPQTKCPNRKCNNDWLHQQLIRAYSKSGKLLVETPLVSVVTPLAVLYTGALLWKEFTREAGSHPEQKRHKRRRKTDKEEEEEEREKTKEKARMEKEKAVKKQEHKLELAREIMGIHADILRLISYTTATGTQTLELANNLRHDLRIKIPGLPRRNTDDSSNNQKDEDGVTVSSKVKASLQENKIKASVAKVNKKLGKDFNSTLIRLKKLQNMLTKLS